MDYGLTPQGFKAKRFEDIVSDISEDIKNEFGIDINSDPDNKLKTLINILSLPLAQNWSSVQALQSVMDIDQATDIYLDMLCASKLVYRERETFSDGVAFVFIDYDSTLTLPAESSFFNVNSKEFQTKAVLSLDNTSCHGARIQVSDFYTGTISFTYAGESFSRNVTDEGSLVNALEALRLDVINKGFYSDPDETLFNTLTFYKTAVSGATTKAAFTEVSGIQTTSVIGFVDVQYTEAGDFTFLPNSFTTQPPFNAIVDYQNTIITGGRYRETDEELRQRFKDSVNLLGNATALAIKSKILSVSGVTQVNVKENDTTEVSEEGNPPKSVEVVVQGGTDVDVGNKLYEVIGAGIESYGNTKVIVEDVNGEDKGIFFSRLQEYFVWVDIEYTKYSEEDFPVDGEDQIKQTVLNYINSLEPSVDVIRGRVSANIFSNVSGLEEITVLLFGSDDPQATPVFTDQAVRIPLGERAFTTLTQITVAEQVV